MKPNLLLEFLRGGFATQEMTSKEVAIGPTNLWIANREGYASLKDVIIEPVEIDLAGKTIITKIKVPKINKPALYEAMTNSSISAITAAKELPESLYSNDFLHGFGYDVTGMKELNDPKERFVVAQDDDPDFFILTLYSALKYIDIDMHHQLTKAGQS